MVRLVISLEEKETGDLSLQVQTVQTDAQPLELQALSILQQQIIAGSLFKPAEGLKALSAQAKDKALRARIGFN